MFCGPRLSVGMGVSLHCLRLQFTSSQTHHIVLISAAAHLLWRLCHLILHFSSMDRGDVLKTLHEKLKCITAGAAAERICTICALKRIVFVLLHSGLVTVSEL